MNPRKKEKNAGAHQLLSKMGVIPSPDLAETCNTVSGSTCNSSEISNLLKSGWARGKSIFVKTGIISKSSRIACS